MGSSHLETRDILAAAERQGFRKVKTTSGHYKLYAPNGRDIVLSSGKERGKNVKALLSHLRRAGFKEEIPVSATTNLGDALSKALPLARPRVKDILIECLTRKPLKVWAVEDLIVIVRHARPDIQRAVVYQALSQLMSDGKVVRADRGSYRWDVQEHSEPTVVTNEKEFTAPALAPSLQSTPEPQPAALAPAPPATISDLSTDQDLAELDEALAALAKLEQMVKKHRAVVQQLAALKKLLNGAG